MITRWFGAGSTAGRLKAHMDASARSQREIAHNIANIANGNFGQALDAQMAAANAEADLEREMVNLADTQLNFEAATKLLQKSYQKLRISFRER